MRFVPILIAALLAFTPLAKADDDDMVVKASPHSVSQTLDRLQGVLESKGITIFLRVDHAANAEKAGLTMKPTQLLIFGNPKLGTPLMVANPKIAIELPMKALAWEDDAGKVWLGYIKPDELDERFDVEGQDEIIKKMSGALDAMTDAAIKAQ